MHLTELAMEDSVPPNRNRNSVSCSSGDVVNLRITPPPFSGLPYLLDFFCSKTPEFIISVQFMVQQIINSISGMTLENGKGDKPTMKKYSKEIDSVRVKLSS